MSGARYRRCYADEPGLLERVFSLLDLAFAGLSAHARAIEAFDVRWDRISTPFVLADGGDVLAHVGVLEMPMVVDGREMPVGGVHAVCTHPEHRSRGHFRAVMTEVLAWCDERYAAILLCGDRELYERFGFHFLEESRFLGAARRSVDAPNELAMRRLDLMRAEDLRLLNRLLAERAPASRRLGVVRERDVFLFNQATEPLCYAEDLDAVLCFEVDDGTLRLHDVVATQIPALQQIVDRVDAPIEHVEVYFSPDQLDASLTAESHVLGGDGWIMTRGVFPYGRHELMLPSTARY